MKKCLPPHRLSSSLPLPCHDTICARCGSLCRRGISRREQRDLRRSQLRRKLRYIPFLSAGAARIHIPRRGAILTDLQITAPSLTRSS